MDYKIVVFEGNELCGKSTLKKEFEIATNFRHLCIDRMYITSIIYNRFKNRHNDLEETLYDDLDKFIKQFDPLFVIVRADLEVQLKRYDDRGEWYIKREELKTLNEMYAEMYLELINLYPSNIILLENNEMKDIETNVNNIQNYLESL